MKTVMVNFEIPLQSFFYDSIKAVLYAANKEIFFKYL